MASALRSTSIESIDLNQQFKLLEDHTFSVELGIASTRKLFRELLKSHPSVNLLFESLVRSPELSNDVLNRIRSIAKIGHNPNYANPYDAPLSAYLWCLNAKQLNSPELARFAASETLKINDLWWARDFAVEILAREEHQTIQQVVATEFRAQTDNRPLAGGNVVQLRPARASTQNRIVSDFTTSYADVTLNVLKGELSSALSDKSDTPKWNWENTAEVKPPQVLRYSTHLSSKKMTWATNG